MEYHILNIENQTVINAKAKTKANGVYTLRGILYLVKNFRVEYFATAGEIIQGAGHFNYVVGTYDRRITDKELKNKLLALN